MARVLVASDDGSTTVEILDEDDYTTGTCDRCGETLSDRGHFEDTIQAAQIHLDQHH